MEKNRRGESQEKGHDIKGVFQAQRYHKIEIPKDITDSAFWHKVATYQFIYSLLGLIIGLCCVIGGILLFFHGITGSTSWTAKFLGAESNLSDAAPGVVLFIVGLFVIWITKFGQKIKS